MSEKEPVSPKRGFTGWLPGYLASFPFTAIIAAGAFFALSLSPSLVPRSPAIQGVLSGLSAAVGFWVGLGLVWIWNFLELPVLRGKTDKVFKAAVAFVTAALVFYFLWLTSSWQDSARELMRLEPLTGAYAPIAAVVAAPTAFVLLLIGYGFSWVCRYISGQINRFVPRRISMFAGLVAATWLLATVVNGTLGRWGMEAMDAAFLAVDQRIDPDLPPPSDAGVTGSAQSLISWKNLGRQGRRFMTSGPTQQDIQSRVSGEAMRPIRVYAGLGAGQTHEARAKLALEELKRVGAFSRSVLVVATPTGTGWIDEAAADSLEYLHRGDTAIVAQQYSYLTSYVSLFVEPGYSAATARALLKAVYGHWTKLPKANRPKLYLYGLSLGAYGSEQSADLYFMLGDLINGAVWSGPPFRSARWSAFTRDRNPGSPAWLPKFRDGSFVRFTNQTNALGIDGATWGPVRIVYLQYASDPITFFSPYWFLQTPDWLVGKRGPEVSKELDWFPVVTAVQIGFDMIHASDLGRGLGHMYAASHYIDAWLEVTEPDGWSREDVERLKAYMEEQTR